MKAEHPMQPIVFVDKVARFKKNNIVRFILDALREKNGIGLNELNLMPFPAEDWEQFMQLIGYSVSGYGDLNLRPSVVSKADAMVEELLASRSKKKGKKR